MLKSISSIVLTLDKLDTSDKIKAQMAEETKVSRSIKIKPSAIRLARHKAIDSRQTLGRWIEDAIKEKVKREAEQPK